MGRSKHESNRLAWNEAAETYRTEMEKSVQLLKGGGVSFCAPELELLTQIAPHCKKCVHLQCAGGTDTLSFLNLGVQQVVGIDISDEMIQIAREKTRRLGREATWIVSDVLEVPSELNSTADLIYSGRGAINWIMDIDSWAQVIARILKPGGQFYLFEGHPFTFFFPLTATELVVDSEFAGYFEPKIYETKNWPDTYVGKVKAHVEEQAIKYEKVWPVSRVINALIESGLTLRRFEEYPDAYWNEFPGLPESLRRKFPNTFSLWMTKSARL